MLLELLELILESFLPSRPRRKRHDRTELVEIRFTKEKP